MTLLRFMLLWPLIGAVWQIIWWLYGRAKFGRYAADAAVRISLGERWVLKIVVACFFWPIGIWYALSKRVDRKDLVAYAEHMKNKCPDCGEALDEYESRCK